MFNLRVPWNNFYRRNNLPERRGMCSDKVPFYGTHYSSSIKRKKLRKARPHFWSVLVQISVILLYNGFRGLAIAAVYNKKFRTRKSHKSNLF